MARRALQRRLTGETRDGWRPLAWQLATVSALRDETPTVRTFTLELPGWHGHRPGQHVDLRLTAEDGYSVERSYSIASEPERAGEIDITVERLPDGEVSAFLHDTVVVGDRLEVRGPIGGYFVWEAVLGGPLLLVAGALASCRSWPWSATASGPGPPSGRACCSAPGTRRDRLPRRARPTRRRHDGLEVVHTLTRSQPPGWTGYARRIDEPMLAEVLGPLGAASRAYVCGPTALVENAANALVHLGLPAGRIRTERFGPTGT